MKLTLIAILVTLMPFAATLAQTDKVVEGPEMTFVKLEYNFGKIEQGESATYVFKFTNTGTQPIIINEAHGSCGCTVPEWPKEPIMKGESGEIKVTFNSAGKMGLQDKTVTINSNAVNSPLYLHMKGNVEAKPVNKGQSEPISEPSK